MKRIFKILMAISLTVMTAEAATIPFPPELDNVLQGVKKVVMATWNPSSTSSAGSSTVDSGIHQLDVSLPASSIITHSWMYIATQVADAETASGPAGVTKVAFHCEDSANILAATDLTGFAAGSIVGGKQFGTSSATIGASAGGMTDAIANGCTVVATVSGDNASAGNVKLFLEYVTVP